MQLISPNLTRQERVNHSAFLGENSELLTRFIQSHIDYVEDLGVLQIMEFFTS